MREMFYGVFSIVHKVGCSCNIHGIFDSISHFPLVSIICILFCTLDFIGLNLDIILLPKVRPFFL